MSSLIIVESPTKARTIAKFVGKQYKIESSYGHIRDLPKSTMGIDIEHDFEPQYLVPKEAKKHVAELQKTAKKSDEVILATDEDREGEAIAWHLTQALGLQSPHPSSPSRGEVKEGVKRIVFHEITKSAIERALEHPREIDMNLVDAQQARRVLDRLVGYELSPFLWTKVRRGLSAGRVQSVALRLVVEREREIGKFKAEEYWTIEAKLSPSTRNNAPHPPLKVRGGEGELSSRYIFTAKLHELEGQALKKFDIKDKKSADKIVADLKGAEYKVVDIQEKEARRNPAAPFTTSTLQQEAARKLGFSSKQTMVLAQQLYENGHITYMRTDSVNLAEQALRQAQDVIAEKFGKDYVLPAPRRYKTKTRGAQEAHEAIRPTDLAAVPEDFKGEADPRRLKLYDLIWKRTLASQMPEAIFDQTAVDISAQNLPPLERGGKKGEVDNLSRPAATLPSSGERNKEKYLFRASGQVMKFDGFIKVYMEGRDEEESEELAEGELPELHKSEILNLKSLDGVQHFTQPPPRYTDASLVKTLEEFGIGRPSTYAPTISTIIERGYVERKEKKFFPTEIGTLVNDILVEHFPKIVDYQFTAKMEEGLDDVAEGKQKWQPLIREFYEPFKKNLEDKKESVEKKVEMTDIPCPICGKPLAKKYGRFGQFLACQDYPECKGTRPLPEEEAAQKKLEDEYAGKTCPLCGQGKVVIKHGRFGPFLGCDRYPECKYIGKIEKKTGVTCQQCGEGELIEKRTRKGRTFWGCNRYPACDYATWKFPAKDGEARP